jgi:hypothetical protein
MLPIANPNVIYRALSDGAVLFSTQEEAYYGLNEVGARVWELLPPVTQSLAELCDRVSQQYPDVDPGVIRTDVTELLTDLLQHGLVVARAGERTNESNENPSPTGQPHSARVG